MSDYTIQYLMRYGIPTLQQQIEVAVIHASEDIHNEEVTTPDHENRLAWANWANKSSSTAWIPFAWPVSLNPTIAAAIANDPSGSTVLDSDVQFAVNAALPAVIADFILSSPASPMRVNIPLPPPAK